MFNIIYAKEKHVINLILYRPPRITLKNRPVTKKSKEPRVTVSVAPEKQYLCK